MPHRVTTIENLDSEPRDRVFVTFFIVDPSRPISLADRIRPEDPIGFRLEAKEALKTLKSTWGCLNFGKVGFLPNAPEYDMYVAM